MAQAEKVKLEREYEEVAAAVLQLTQVWARRWGSTCSDVGNWLLGAETPLLPI